MACGVNGSSTVMKERFPDQGVRRINPSQAVTKAVCSRHSLPSSVGFFSYRAGSTPYLDEQIQVNICTEYLHTEACVGDRLDRAEASETKG
jgi:hypothetical protein